MWDEFWSFTLGFLSWFLTKSNLRYHLKTVLDPISQHLFIFKLTKHHFTQASISSFISLAQSLSPSYSYLSLTLSPLRQSVEWEALVLKVLSITFQCFCSSARVLICSKFFFLIKDTRARVATLYRSMWRLLLHLSSKLFLSNSIFFNKRTQPNTNNLKVYSNFINKKPCPFVAIVDPWANDRTKDARKTI